MKSFNKTYNLRIYYFITAKNGKSKMNSFGKEMLLESYKFGNVVILYTLFSPISLNNYVYINIE